MQDSSVVECLSQDQKICGSSLYHSILLWWRALHLHLATAVHISIMLLRPVKQGANAQQKQTIKHPNTLVLDNLNTHALTHTQHYNNSCSKNYYYQLYVWIVLLPVLGLISGLIPSCLTFIGLIFADVTGVKISSLTLFNFTQLLLYNILLL